jgi:hypothetical protein
LQSQPEIHVHKIMTEEKIERLKFLR